MRKEYKMTNFKNITINYKKQIINKHVFIKEETRDEILGLIHVEMYLKTQNEYRMVNNTELPKSYIINLSNEKKYENLSFLELTDFKKYLNSIVDKIKEVNELENRICELFGNIYEVNIDSNFFVIHTDEVNEFYKVKMKEFNIQLIPFIMCDLIEKNKNYKNQLFLISSNLFVQLSDYKTKQICTLIQVNDKTGSCQIVAVYFIEKENDKYKISIDIQEKNIDKTLKEEIRKFIEKLEKNN